MTDVLLIDDLAKLLRCSTRTIRQRIADAHGREPWNLPPRMPAIDKRHRWNKVIVERWLDTNGGGSRIRSAG